MEASKGQATDNTRDGARGALKRRGLLAGAAALVAGIAAKQAAQPVRATTTDTNFTAKAGSGTAFFGAVTGYTVGVSVAGSFVGVYGNSPSGSGVQGESQSGIGVFASSHANAGVAASSGTSHAVVGTTLGSGENVSGVRGQASFGVTNGVWGENTSTSAEATGVFGLASTASTSGPTVGVWGRTQSTTAGSIGTLGEATATGGATYGVVGRSSGAGGTGVYGQSASGYGVLGYSTGGSASLSGISTNANIPAFAGGNSVVGGLAASFAGTVFVNGMFVVADMTQKHGLLKHPDGSHRLMYTVEAPESWEEDFGTGTLANGKADVKLDPDFAALIHTDEYHVFLTAHGDYHVHVAERTAVGFMAQVTSGAGAAIKGLAGVSGTFSWRLVARPKSDKKGERLGKFTVPNIPLPDVSKLPKAEAPQVLKKQ